MDNEQLNDTEGIKINTAQDETMSGQQIPGDGEKLMIANQSV